MDPKTVYEAVLAAIKAMGKEELMRCSWFQWKRSKHGKA